MENKSTIYKKIPDENAICKEYVLIKELAIGLEIGSEDDEVNKND